MVYATLGGGAGLAASLAAFRETLGPYRGFFTLTAVLFLAVAHYHYWIRLRGHGRKATRIVLWMSTALTFGIVLVFYVWGPFWLFN